MLTKLFGSLAIASAMFVGGTPAQAAGGYSEGGGCCCSEDCCEGCPDCNCTCDCCENCEDGCDCPNK